MGKNSEVVKGGEIDLVALSKAIWKNRFLVLKINGIFLILGLFIAFTSKVEYEASCKILPENNNSELPNLGGLGGLAGLAGISLDLGSSDGVSVQLYPSFIKSTPSVVSLINHPLFFEKYDTTISSFEYFQNIDNPSFFGLIGKYTIGLPGQIKKLIVSDSTSSYKYDFPRFSKDDWEIIEDFSNRISISHNEENGTVKITVEMPDPVAAAELTQLVYNQLTERLISYRTEKSRQNLQFITSRFEETKLEYEQNQTKLAEFSERNKNVTNSLILNEYERLKNEMDISFEVYKGLAAQLEQAKIKLKEDTPIFTILEPVKIPEDKLKPRRLLILIAFLMVGITWSTIKVIFLKS